MNKERKKKYKIENEMWQVHVGLWSLFCVASSVELLYPSGMSIAQPREVRRFRGDDKSPEAKQCTIRLMMILDTAQELYSEIEASDVPLVIEGIASKWPGMVCAV